MSILFVVFAFVAVLKQSLTCFTLSAKIEVDFVVFEFVEKGYRFEFVFFHIGERRNIYLK